MRTLILRVMDWDATWVGLGRLRPRPDERLSAVAVVAILIVTGVLARAAGPVTYGLLVFALGPARPEFTPLAAGVAAGTVVLNAMLQLYSAAIWNRRADELRAAKTTTTGRGYDEYE